MANGPQTNWYKNLNQAPWTPSGWVFGAAWTLIMVCFSIYMAYLYKMLSSVKVLILFSIQFFLNVIWNYVFFNKHLVGFGLIIILLLTLIVALFLITFRKKLKFKTALIIPYLLWLFIATSLNAYIFFNN